MAHKRPAAARKTFVALGCLTLVCVAMAATALAAAGDLDPFFGTGGKVTTPISSGTDRATGVAIQPDGKIVLAGSSNVGGWDDFALARYNPDGSLDTTFDGDGKLNTGAGLVNERAYGVALQPDGKIVVVGESGAGGTVDFAVARYNVDGSLDTTFDGDGMLTTPIGIATERAYGVALQPDGKIVTAGFRAASNDDIALARYNANGSLDTTFDGDGIRTVAIGTGDERANAMALQPDGKIVVAGETYGGSDVDTALARFNPDGSLDATFDGDGKISLAIGPSDNYANAVALQGDGKIVTAGSHYDGSTEDFVLTRHNADGSLDPTFSGDGTLVTPIGASTDLAKAVAVQPDGKIIAAGEAYGATDADFALAQFNPDGSPDVAFDGDGKLITPFGVATDRAYALALQPDGKIVGAGSGDPGTGSDFVLLRLLGNFMPRPTATITEPAKSKLKAKSLKRFAGTAGSAHYVSEVEIAVQRVNKKLQKRGRCLWLKNSKGAFKKVRDRKRKCKKQRFIKATGTEAWSYKLRRRLAKGSYRLYVRVRLTDGQSHTSFSAAQGNYKTFKLK